MAQAWAAFDNPHLWGHALQDVMGALVAIGAARWLCQGNILVTQKVIELSILRTHLTVSRYSPESNSLHRRGLMTFSSWQHFALLMTDLFLLPHLAAKQSLVNLTIRKYMDRFYFGNTRKFARFFWSFKQLPSTTKGFYLAEAELVTLWIFLMHPNSYYLLMEIVNEL